MKLYIDDREHDESLKESFRFVSAERIFDYEIAHLEVGDVVCGNICIERKTASDFILSIMDNRLKEQAHKMQLSYEYKYIIIEGSPFQTQSAMSDNAIIGKMCSLLVKHGIGLIFVENQLQFVYTCYFLIKKHMEEHEFNPNYIAASLPKKTDDDILTQMLFQFPRLGYAKAQAISQMYENSLYKFCTQVTPNQLQTIDGIGKTMSMRICEFIKK